MEGQRRRSTESAWGRQGLIEVGGDGLSDELKVELSDGKWGPREDFLGNSIQRDQGGSLPLNSEVCEAVCRDNHVKQVVGLDPE